MNLENFYIIYKKIYTLHFLSSKTLPTLLVDNIYPYRYIYPYGYSQTRRNPIWASFNDWKRS